jgi:hypothetical protein
MPRVPALRPSRAQAAPWPQRRHGDGGEGDLSAEGECQASTKLAEAAAVIGEHPTALQLRYLQTLLEISGTNSSTTILPVPIGLMLRPM